MKNAWVWLALALTGCGPSYEEQLRTVTSYEFSSCDVAEPTDAKELAALDAFRSQVQRRYFTRLDGSLFASNREETATDSGLREYEGPFHVYVHPRKIEPEEAREGVEWVGMVYLHAANVRSRTNGGDWGEWEKVRTRNFATENRTVDGMGRWKCLVNAEIAWAQVTLRQGSWEVMVGGASAYDWNEVPRLLPSPTTAQIEEGKDVTPLSAAELSGRT